MEIRWKTPRNNRAPPVHYVKLCASFQSHRRIQTGVTVRECSIWVKFVILLSPSTSKFDKWSQKTIGHIFLFTSSFVLHFIAIYQFEMELQSGNAKFGSKSAIFFVPYDLEIWRTTLKNNMPPLLCSFMLCVSFHSLLWNQNEVTVRKHQIWVKIGDVVSRVTLKFDRWPWKIIGHLFYATSSLVHHFIAICEFKMQLQSGNAQFWSRLAIFLSCVTLKFDRWHWKTRGHLFYAMSSFVHHLIAICEFKLELQSGNDKFGSKSAKCFSRVTLKFSRWPW